MDEELKHLRWLANGYYANAAIMALFGLFPVIHLAIGIAIVSGGFPDPNGKGPPAFMGWIFIVAAILIMAMMFAVAICNFMAGKYIQEHKKYTFVFVMGALNCMFAPLGMILGVFTIILLLREPVKGIFNQPNALGYQPDAGTLPPDWR